MPYSRSIPYVGEFAGRRPARVLARLLGAILIAACNDSVSDAAPEPPTRDAGAEPDPVAEADADERDASMAFDAGAGPEPAFVGPDASDPHTPAPGSCGLVRPAFCDSFETLAHDDGRTGELAAERWSVVRAAPGSPASLEEAFAIGPIRLPRCRADLPERVQVDQDTLICDPTEHVPTRHLLTSAAAQNYGLSSYRIRQPFDFAGRTGTIKFDVDLSNNGLGGWPALVIAEEPALAPSFDWEERGSGPRNGVSIEFNSGWCNHPNTLEVSAFSFREYAQSAQRASFDCETPHVGTQRHALNHVEIYLTRKQLEVWASDPSPDGVAFPNFQRLYSLDLDLSFERGYVHLLVRNHASMKYWLGSAWSVRWDNVGFDGPVVAGPREFSARDAVRTTRGLDGCMIAGSCRWRGDVIAQYPEEGMRCSQSCTLDDDARSVGYVIPNADEEPVAIIIPGVAVGSAQRAQLALAATYPWFDWNGVSKPPTAMILRYRLNGGAWHDRPVSQVEATAFRDFSQAAQMGGAGHGAGLLNQIVELDVGELRDGDNRLELRSAGTWTGSYRLAVAALDLLLHPRP